MIVRTSDRLTVFLYLLLRDHLHAGAVEKMMMDVENPKAAGCDLSNELIAKYAQDVSDRLQNYVSVGEANDEGHKL